MGDQLRALLEEFWGMKECQCTHFATRENIVYRVMFQGKSYALKSARRGYHDASALRSELAFLHALDGYGLDVPKPIPTKSKNFLVCLEGYSYALTSWLEGKMMAEAQKKYTKENLKKVFSSIGKILAQLHLYSDRYAPGEDFYRHAWDKEGLVGTAPFWGCFWEHPVLDKKQKAHFKAFREYAFTRLSDLKADYGLIHADAVPENILIKGNTLSLIDFDDFGWGYRLFDIVTVLLKNDHEEDFELLKAALIKGYHTVRPLDLDALPLFMALRAVSYIGWVGARPELDANHQRAMRYRDHALNYTLSVMEAA